MGNMKHWKLILVRHGDTGENFRHRYIGSMDIPLSMQGRQQVSSLRKMFGDDLPDLRLCSPLGRCLETAEILLEGTPGGFKIDADLREIDFGKWENMTFNDILVSSPGDVARWSSFDPDFSFPNGEAIQAFQARLKHFVEHLENSHVDSALVITHVGVIRFLICQLLQLEPWQYILFKIKTASTTVIDVYEGRGVLAGFNLTGEANPGILSPKFI
jgi:broad specificity phosphatase PhoE